MCLITAEISALLGDQKETFLTDCSLIVVPKEIQYVQQRDIRRLTDIDAMLVAERVVAKITDLNRLLEGRRDGSGRVGIVKFRDGIDSVCSSDSHLILRERS